MVASSLATTVSPLSPLSPLSPAANCHHLDAKPRSLAPLTTICREASSWGCGNRLGDGNRLLRGVYTGTIEGNNSRTKKEIREAWNEEAEKGLQMWQAERSVYDRSNLREMVKRRVEKRGN